MTTRMSKQVLRRELRLLLKGMTGEERARQSRALTARVMESTWFKESERVGVYLSLVEREVDTGGIIGACFSANKHVFVPRFDPKTVETRRELDLVRVRSQEDVDSLPADKWRVRQPRVEESERACVDVNELDVLFVPGVGFTRSGQRLGNGMAFYDTLLGKRRGKRPLVVGLAFNEQLLEEKSWECESHDKSVDLVLTGE